METTKNIIIEGTHNKPILVDIFYNNTNAKKPVLIFCHGYKGYKDWGAWNLMAGHVANNNICLIKFNFSHNGGTVEQIIDFPDLETFGQNNYTKELDDLDTVINWVEKEYCNHPGFDTSNIILLGHSRGGGIVTLKAQEDSRISKVISLAGVSDFENRFPKDEALKKWKEDGVMYVVNGRTKQNMPHYYQFYENFMVNANRLNIKRAASSLIIPHLIIHGDADTSVVPAEAYALHNWNPNSKLSIIKNADHVFNSKHPWEENQLTPQLLEVVDLVSEFIRTP
ncbi:MAG: alpha/beta hydrolase [Bacteroidia bacterium]|nr:alpha/beta hydrolase [Bacteroidia bacterium]